MMKFHAISLMAIAAVVSSCINTEGYIHYEDINPDIWPKEQAVEFIPDSAIAASLTGQPAIAVVSLRYTPLSSAASVPVEILQESFDAPARVDTIRFSLFKPNGRPVGVGIHSAFEVSDTIPIPYLPAGWRLTVSPLAPTPGIHAVGLTLLPR